jgi:hypothetical protein
VPEAVRPSVQSAAASQEVRGGLPPGVQPLWQKVLSQGLLSTAPLLRAQHDRRVQGQLQVQTSTTTTSVNVVVFLKSGHSITMSIKINDKLYLLPGPPLLQIKDHFHQGDIFFNYKRISGFIL